MILIEIKIKARYLKKKSQIQEKTGAFEKFKPIKYIWIWANNLVLFS